MFREVISQSSNHLFRMKHTVLCINIIEVITSVIKPFDDEWWKNIWIFHQSLKLFKLLFESQQKIIKKIKITQVGGNFTTLPQFFKWVLKTNDSGQFPSLYSLEEKVEKTFSLKNFDHTSFSGRMDTQHWAAVKSSFIFKTYLRKFSQERSFTDIFCSGKIFYGYFCSGKIINRYFSQVKSFMDIFSRERFFTDTFA